MKPEAPDSSTSKINERDIPTLLGLRSQPSPWEIYHRIKGDINLAPSASARSYWRRQFFNPILAGLQERYKCILAHSGGGVTPNGIAYKGLTEITHLGLLPLPENVRFMRIRQVSEQETLAKWKTGLGFQAPRDVIAEMHVVMAIHNLDCLGIALIIDGGNDEAFLTVERDPKIDNAITDAVVTFSARLAADREPDPDYQVDGSMIQDFYAPTADAECDLTNRPDLVEKIQEYERLSAERRTHDSKSRDIKSRIDPIKNELMHVMGHAAAAKLDDGITISRSLRQVKPNDGYSFQVINISTSKAKADKAA